MYDHVLIAISAALVAAAKDCVDEIRAATPDTTDFDQWTATRGERPMKLVKLADIACGIVAATIGSVSIVLIMYGIAWLLEG